MEYRNRSVKSRKYYWWSSFLILFGMFVLVSDVSAINKYSFRMRGMGTNLNGFMDDLYSDIYLNPGYLYRFKQNHIYTNLSNIQGQGRTSVFGEEPTSINQDGNFPTNVIGFIGTVRSSKIGAFWESTGHSFELDDRFDEDLPLGGNALRRNSTTNRLKGGYNGQGISLFGMYKDYGIFFSYENVGLTLEWENGDRIEQFAGLDTTKITHQTDYGTLKFPSSFLSFAVGKVFHKYNKEYSISAGIMPERIGLNMDQVFSLFAVNLGQLYNVFVSPYSNGKSKGLDYFSEEQIGFSELGVRNYFLNTRMKVKYPQLESFHQVNYIFTINRYSLPLELESRETFRSMADSTQGGSRIITNENIHDQMIGDGSSTIWNMTAGIGGERHFDSFNSMFALGAKLSYLTGNLKLDQGPGRRDHMTVDENLGTGTIDTTMYQINDRQIIQTKGTGSMWVLSLPVGLETKLSKKLTVRLGANAIIPLKFDGTWTVTKTDSINQVESRVPETAPDPDLGETYAYNETDSGLSGTLYNLSSYHFGATYDISESVRIDFLHFAQLTDLRTWWLSLTLKY